jgi:hypothetical protein
LTLSRRFTASLRFGEVVQEFSGSGDKASSPYLEASMNYRITPQTILGFNGRYGYEEAGAANTRNLVARGGLQLTQIFSPRFQGVLSVNLLRSSSTTTSGSDVAATTNTNGTGNTATPATSPQTQSGSTDTVQDTVDTSLGFYYTLDRHWSLNLTYSYTMVVGPVSTADYYRQRVFLGAAYQF